MSNSDTPSTAKGRSKLLMIGVPVAVLLLGGAGGGFWYVKNVRAASATGSEKKPVEEAEATGYLRFEPFTLNLADPGGRRYLRITVGLVLQDADMAKKVSEDELVVSKVRSTLIDTISGRMAADLSTPDGRAALKKAIAEAASHAGHMEVRDVLFTDFIVQ